MIQKHFQTVLFLSLVLVGILLPGKIFSQASDAAAAIQEACNRLVNEGIYKSCKAAPGFSAHQGYYSQSAQVKCECINKKDNNKTIVTITLGQYY
ncbi:hypothetical protein [Leptospira noguchii]|uniref:Uncharacterized protein n=1 Tax=Leptospira noguchii TaxID=28182 RepID=A0A9Q8RHL6_9LEPT|nr:hypothetical protein [Leptospira noguchii]EMO26479.1 hypothetical protein LEP1GSC170_1101 [Leptospira interrogans serovar Bataviae str. HAI135]EKR72634.1 hypothetical protein LEP1GSC041_3928 [Leptospira noguchii str. 2006001870]EMI65071.1 hypothetical protein LEP1GSC072_3806 [Leptospira noguchii str. Bonito]EMS88118.1 hypothetical protein LEP1GSC073_1869 [Leptospira noguchii str. Cascata]EMS89359.1 hypothetical protein LEP1GSC074_2801 [Leptospira noguchii str. Hook]